MTAGAQGFEAGDHAIEEEGMACLSINGVWPQEVNSKKLHVYGALYWSSVGMLSMILK